MLDSTGDKSTLSTRLKGIKQSYSTIRQKQNQIIFIQAV